ncbi:MAG: hypothetical protein U0L98_02145 [Clostridia bacterium]|nr:hypothetical protein [Clostridia bacterium]
MYKIIFKFIVIILLSVLIINILPNISYCDDDWVGQADDFINKADGTIGIDKEKLKEASDDIYNILTSVGMILSVIIGISLGIIYMMASAVDKAKVKETLAPFLIGSFVIFGAFGIWKLVINTLGGL